MIEKYLPLASFIVAALGLLWIYFGAVINIKERLVKLETKIELFWKPLENFLTAAIHHPTTPILDHKLDNFTNLTKNELEELKVEINGQLKELQKIDKENPKILFYALLLARVEQKVHDLQEKADRAQNEPIMSKLFRFLLGRA